MGQRAHLLPPDFEPYTPADSFAQGKQDPLIDGSSQDWWALELDTRPYGPDKQERVIGAATEPASLPDLTTFYLVTNLPAPGSKRAQASRLAAASLQEVVRLYGLRMWVEQSYSVRIDITFALLSHEIYFRQFFSLSHTVNVFWEVFDESAWTMC